MFSNSQFLLKFVFPGSGRRLTFAMGLTKSDITLTPEEKFERDIVLSKKIARLKIEMERLIQIDDERKAGV